MKTHLRILATFILLVHSGTAFTEEEEAIVVRLQTESPLSPLYLLPVAAVETHISSKEIHDLESILAFDLGNNGSTVVAKRSDTANQIGASAANQVGPASGWLQQHIFFVVRPKIAGNELSATVLDVQQQTMKSIHPLPLTGDLKEDRRQVHRLADTIHKSFFGTSGIASSKVLYTLKTPSANDKTQTTSEVWEADYDGGNAKQLTRDGSTAVTPVYMPAKKGFSSGSFLYVSYEIGEPKIYIASKKDGKKSRCIKMRGNQLMPAVSLQRDKIAFISDVTGNPDLFLQPFSPESGATDKPQQIFAAPLATQGSPTFSPDGKKIAFVSNKDGSPKIYVMDIPPAGASLKEIKATAITKVNRENSAPSWSPDGKKIAYTARTKTGDRQIWVYDFDSQREKQITTGKGHKENPTWGSNSLHLIYNTSDPGVAELYLINLNQLEPVRITSGSGEKRFPNFEQ